MDDPVFPIADHYLLLEHGDPKSDRFLPGGPMEHGGGSAVADTPVTWLAGRLLS